MSGLCDGTYVRVNLFSGLAVGKYEGKYVGDPVGVAPQLLQDPAVLHTAFPIVALLRQHAFTAVHEPIPICPLFSRHAPL
jgi:hypothetical protein